MKAAESGDKATIVYLLQLGANPAEIDFRGRTARSYAIAYHSVDSEAASILLEAE